MSQHDGLVPQKNSQFRRSDSAGQEPVGSRWECWSRRLITSERECLTELLISPCCTQVASTYDGHVDKMESMWWETESKHHPPAHRS